MCSPSASPPARRRSDCARTDGGPWCFCGRLRTTRWLWQARPPKAHGFRGRRSGGSNQRSRNGSSGSVRSWRLADRASGSRWTAHARDYAAGDWQTQVDAFLHDAATIVLVVSQSSGVSWEVRRLTESGLLAKTLWILPPVLKAEALRRWRACIAQMKVIDPQIAPPSEEDVARSCLVYFDGSGQGRTLGRRRALGRPYERALDALSEAKFFTGNQAGSAAVDITASPHNCRRTRPSLKEQLAYAASVRCKLPGRR